MHAFTKGTPASADHLLGVVKSAEETLSALAHLLQSIADSTDFDQARALAVIGQDHACARMDFMRAAFDSSRIQSSASPERATDHE